MASNKSVIVLAPNGRRQTVKVTPNHTILQVLEEVCRKQGYKAQEYELRHHNHILDTQTILRFSGLPNNAMLEMSEAIKIREESDVVLGIQLEDGTRLLGTFSPSANLFAILDDLCPQHSHPDLNPVVIYMRREVFGEGPLKTTTLRALGLTGGRAMLRLIHRTPEELKHQANVSGPLPVKSMEEKPPEFRPKPKPLKCDNASNRVTNAIATALKSENEQQSSLKPRPSILSVTPNDNDNRNIPKRDLVEPECSHSKAHSSNGIKQQRLDVRSKSPEDQYEEEDIKFLGERNAVAYSLSNCNVVTAMYNDLPDDFFDLTVNDVRKLLSDLKKKRTEIDDAPLQTRELKKLEESKKILCQLGLYKRCVLRIQFPDRIVLQGTFLPSESIETVMDFVRDYLQHPGMNFHLFMTPPKIILKPQDTLVEIGCVPSALIHFGIQGVSTVAINNTPSNLRAPFLNSTVMTSLSTPTAAILAATKSRGLITIPNEEDNNEATSSETRSAGYERAVSPSRPSGALTVPPPLTDRKMPKWFKPSK